MGRVAVAAGTIKKHLSKADKENRIEREKKLKIDRDKLTAPDWLDDTAKKEFERVVAETAKADMLDNLDLGVVAIYADAWSRYIELAEQIREEGMVVELTGSRGQPYTKVNPAVIAQQTYVDRIYKASTKLGIACTDRLKLTVVQNKDEKPENRFEKYSKE